ncbi:MAG: hypothetical protein QOK05_483 [Chloroflexota bacterium]|nr:hypothetical protein [Chloroflexota bacterium]
MFLCAAAPLAGARVAAASTGWHDWTGRPTNVFRDATYDRGEFIYSNGIFQALGANSDTLHRTEYFPGTAAPIYSPPNDLYRALTYDFFGAHRATHNGDFQLPTDRTRFPEFTADLAELRLAATSTDLYVRVQFTSFPRPDAQVATLTFASSAGLPAVLPWPHNAGVRSPWSAALTLSGTGATLDTPTTPQTLVAAGGAFRTADHVYEARVPLAALPPGPWTLTGGSGLNDPASSGNYWTVPAGTATATQPGSGFLTAPGSNVWDLLFARDTTWTFDERKQADDLLGGDVSNDSQAVSPALMTAGASQPAGMRTGDISRFFQSRVATADGIDRSVGIVPFGAPQGTLPPLPTDDFDVTFHYTGGLQPYYMHIPAAYPGHTVAYPLIVYLHGFTGLPDEPFYNPIGLVDTADQKGYLLASALGRGDYSYRGPGDIDVKEVIADVERHYDVDPNRIYLMGHSMGGYGTNNMAIHNPDLFAAVAPAEGTDSIDLHQNLRNVPWLEMTAEEDLDTMGTNAKKLYGNLSGDGYDATLVDWKFKIHEYSSIYDTLPRIFDFFAAHTRNPNPPAVSYSRLPGEDQPAIGLVYDHAYWLSGLRSADATKRSDNEVETFGIAHAALDPAAAVKTDVTAAEAGGQTGLPRTLAEVFSTAPAYGPQQAVRNAATLKTTNTEALALDLGRMGLRDDCTLTLDVTADHGLAINLGDRTVNAAAGTSTLTVGTGACGAPTAAGMPNTATVSPAAALIVAFVVVFAAGVTGFARRRRG